MIFLWACKTCCFLYLCQSPKIPKSSSRYNRLLLWLQLYHSCYFPKPLMFNESLTPKFCRFLISWSNKFQSEPRLAKILQGSSLASVLGKGWLLSSPEILLEDVGVLLCKPESATSPVFLVPQNWSDCLKMRRDIINYKCPPAIQHLWSWVVLGISWGTPNSGNSWDPISKTHSKTPYEPRDSGMGVVWEWGSHLLGGPWNFPWLVSLLESSLKLTVVRPLKMDAWKMKCPFGMPILSYLGRGFPIRRPSSMGITWSFHEQNRKTTSRKLH